MQAGRIVCWIVALLLAGLGPATAFAQQAAEPYGLVFIIDADHYRNADANVAAAMLEDIRRMDRSAPEARLAIIVSSHGRTATHLPDARERSRLDRFISSRLDLNRPARHAASSLDLNAVRHEVLKLDALWRLSTPPLAGRDKRVVLVRVFALRWHLDWFAGVTGGFGELYEFEYPNDCLRQYAETNRGWPDASILDIEFRPPLHARSPPPGAFTGFLVALTGRNLTGREQSMRNVNFRGWAGPNCETGQPRAIPDIRHEDPEAPFCEGGMRRALQGPPVQACVRAPSYPALADGLVRRPVNLVTDDGSVAADSIATVSLPSGPLGAGIRIDRSPIAHGSRPQPLPAGGSSRASVSALLQPEQGCRGRQTVAVTLHIFGPGGSADRQDRSLAVSDAPCKPLVLPMGEIRRR